MLTQILSEHEESELKFSELCEATAASIYLQWPFRGDKRMGGDKKKKGQRQMKEKEKERDKSFLTLHLFPLSPLLVLDIDISPRSLTDN